MDYYNDYQTIYETTKKPIKTPCELNKIQKVPARGESKKSISGWKTCIETDKRSGILKQYSPWGENREGAERKWWWEREEESGRCSGGCLWGLWEVSGAAHQMGLRLFWRICIAIMVALWRVKTEYSSSRLCRFCMDNNIGEEAGARLVYSKRRRLNAFTIFTISLKI